MAAGGRSLLLRVQQAQRHHLLQTASHHPSHPPITPTTHPPIHPSIPHQSSPSALRQDHSLRYLRGLVSTVIWWGVLWEDSTSGTLSPMPTDSPEVSPPAPSQRTRSISLASWRAWCPQFDTRWRIHCKETLLYTPFERARTKMRTPTGMPLWSRVS